VSSNPDTSGRPIFILGRGVIDGTGTGLLEGVGVLIRDGLIAAVGTPADVETADAVRVDAGDGVIVPGFIDSHTHVTIRPGEGDQHGQIVKPHVWQAIRGVENLRRMIASGVTTAKSMTEEAEIDIEYREAVERGEIAGPRIRASRRGFSPPGGHGSAAGAVSGVDDLRAAVRDHVAHGADHIKIFTTGGVSSEHSSLDESAYSPEEIAAIVDEAAAAGLKVSAHAHGGPGLDYAVQNGIHSVEHGAMISEESAAAMAEHGTWLVMTNSILFHPTGIEQGDAKSPAIMAKVKTARVSALRSAQVVKAAGIRIAVGTDSMHGLIGFEMQWLVEQGWTPEEALVAATRSGAELIGLDDTGTIETGKRADLVVLRRNPLEDITAVYDIESVYRRGFEVVTSDGTVRVPAAGRVFA
jgi:imidazolonepropionase-like amidohydrolase